MTDDDVAEVVTSDTGYSIAVRDRLADAILTAVCEAQGQSRDMSGQDRRLRNVETLDALMMVAGLVAYVGPPLATDDGVTAFCAGMGERMAEHVDMIQSTSRANGMASQSTRIMAAVVGREIDLPALLFPQGDGNPAPEHCSDELDAFDAVPAHLKRKLN
jgi:hypothetical protein